MSTPAGWYPDPQEQGRLRYWDGAAWTEHQAPAQGAVPMPAGGGHGAFSASQQGNGGHPVAPAPEQNVSWQRPSAGYGPAPAPGSAEQTSPYGPISDPAMQYGTQTAGPGAVPPPGTPPPGTPGTPPPGTPGGKPNRVPLVVGGVIGLVIVIGLIVLGVQLIIGGSEEEPTAGPTTSSPAPTDGPTDQPTDQPTDPQPQGGTDMDAGALTVGSSVQLDLAGGQRATLTLTVTEAAPIRIYTTSDIDPVLTVVDAQGNEVVSDDDTEYQSSNSFDASVTAALPAGEYTVQVRDYYSSTGAVEVTAEAAGEVQELALGANDFDLAAGEVFVGSLSLEPGTYSIDVASDADPTIALVVPGQPSLSSDDRSADDPPASSTLDPYLELTVDQSVVAMVTLEEFWGDAVSGTVTIAEQ